MNLKVTLFIVLLQGFFVVNAQVSMKQINIAHQYNPDKVYDVKLFGHFDDESLMLTGAYKFPDTLTELPIIFWGAADYSQPLERIDSLIAEERYLGEREGYHYYQYQISTAKPLVVVEMITGTETSDFYDYFFNLQQLPSRLILSSTKLPVMDRWVKDRTYYQMVGDQDQFNEWTVTYYDHNFEAASPPMVSKKVENKEVLPDSTFLLYDQIDLTFRRNGLYLFQLDTTSIQGYSWLLFTDPYPDLNTLDKLIAPLRYITTNEEWKRLKANSDKATFDKFWLDLGGNQNKARSMISSYYNRVENANRYFTTYKEGWKTDRGMIYIIYGQPSIISKNENEEIWVYESENKQMIFTFLRYSHIFYPFNYVLHRSDKYRNSWFTTVDQIRNGYFR